MLALMLLMLVRRMCVCAWRAAQAAQPSLGVGKLKNRENLAHYGTDREGALRNPDDPFFKRYAAECSRNQISVDVFAFGSGYMDLASLAAIPRYTCGEVREGGREGTRGGGGVQGPRL